MPGSNKKHFDELKDFRKWLASPWVNNSNTLIELYDALTEFHPEFPSSVLTKQNLFQKIYPDKPYHDKLLRNLMGELAKRLDSYFTHTFLRNNPEAQKELLMEAYFQRNHTVPAIKVAQKELELCLNKSVKGADDYLRAFNLEKRILQHPSMRTKVLTNKNLLRKLEGNLDVFYAIQKMKIVADQKDRHKFVSEEEQYSRQNLDFLNKLVHDTENPLISIYQILQTDELDPHQKFKLAKKQFYDSFDLLVEEDQKLILARLQNILINLYSRGYQDVVVDIFELSSFSIRTRLLVDNGKITDRTFINVVTSGNQSGAFQYVRTFIDTYYNKVDPKLSQDVKNWADAHYLYHRGKYGECINQVSSSNISNPTFSDKARTLELLAYFELLLSDDTYHKILSNKLRAFRRKLYRDKVLPKSRRDSYLGFISNLKKLADLAVRLKHDQNDDGEITKLEVNIGSQGNLLLKFWLINHLRKLREDSTGHPPN